MRQKQSCKHHVGNTMLAKSVLPHLPLTLSRTNNQNSNAVTDTTSMCTFAFEGFAKALLRGSLWPRRTHRLEASAGSEEEARSLSHQQLGDAHLHWALRLHIVSACCQEGQMTTQFITCGPNFNSQANYKLKITPSSDGLDTDESHRERTSLVVLSSEDLNLCVCVSFSFVLSVTRGWILAAAAERFHNVYLHFLFSMATEAPSFVLCLALVSWSVPCRFLSISNIVHAMRFEILSWRLCLHSFYSVVFCSMGRKRGLSFLFVTLGLALLSLLGVTYLGKFAHSNT